MLENEKTRIPRILVVDDNDDTRDAICRMLEPLEAIHTSATDGQTALEILENQDIDVVISDLVMPNMSGMLLLHTMLEKGISVPFVFVTGYPDADSAVQALRLGAFDYLEKPVNSADLQSVVKEALSVSRQQKNLAALLREDGSPLTSQDASAEVKIMKMRTLRYHEETLDYPISRGRERTWQELRDLFVQEAQTQLAFCESAIQNLVRRTDMEREIAYLFRVMQSIRQAAEAIRVNDIAEFTWLLENCLAGLRFDPRSITAERMDVLSKAFCVTGAKIENLADSRAQQVHEQLTRLTEELSLNDKPITPKSA